MENKAKRAALYARVSTDAQMEEGYSIDAQKEMLAAYCVTKNITAYEFYVDGGFSGSTIERPEMKRLISDVKAGTISHVIVYKLDRLSRSQKDTLFLIEDVFNPSHTDFVSLNENMDTSTPIGRAMLGIMSAFAQLERETIRERTRIGMRERVKSGLWQGGGHVPFGYDYDREKGILVPNKDADTVRKIYELYLDGYSLMKIARIVGLKYEKLAEQIMMRKTNTGYIFYNGSLYKGQHEPIVSEEIYNKAMEMKQSRSRKGLTTSRSLLAGLLYCGVCGAKMRYQKWGKNGYKIYCYSQDSGKPHLSKSGKCNNTKHWAYEVEEIVIRDLFRMAHKNIGEINADDSETGNSVLEALRGSLAECTRRLKRLYSVYAGGESEILLETIKETENEYEKIKKQVSLEEKQGLVSLSVRKAYEKLDGIADMWELMTFSERQNLIRQCVEKIVITMDKIDIYYFHDGTFIGTA